MQLIQVPFVLTPECQTTIRGLLLGKKGLGSSFQGEQLLFEGT